MSNDIEFLTAYSPSKQVGLKCSEPSLTEQCYKDECSIDYIINTIAKTGIDPREGSMMSYQDCTTVKSFEDAQNLVAETKSMFYSLPPAIVTGKQIGRAHV